MPRRTAPDEPFEEWLIRQQEDYDANRTKTPTGSDEEEFIFTRAVSPQGSGHSTDNDIELASSGLCSQCIRIVNYVDSMRGQSGDELDIPMRFKPSVMKTSPCDICRIIYRGLDQIQGAQAIENWFFRLSFFVGGSFRVTSRGVRPSGAGQYIRPDLKCDIYFFIPDETTCPWSIFPTSPLYNIHPVGSESFLEKAREFAYRCSSEHSCIPKGDDPTLPTRVLDIGEVDSPDNIKVLFTQGRKGRYLCLSHCWGGHQPIQTTKQTTQSYSRSLPLRSIPRTYCIAIDFARKLGVRYIWIDSLCIIQDDEEDWARESARMCEIFENSYLTIAATSSPNCSFDVFQIPPRKMAEIRGINATGKPFCIMASDRIRHPDVDTTPHDLLRNWPLLSRAWVFQEILMSPRILHLTRFEIIWECKDGSRCECGNMPSSSREGHHQIMEQFSGPELAIRWHDLVESYSRLSITYDSDRLPALSGLVKQMARKRPSATYLAGLWEDSIAIDLLWTKSRGSTQPASSSNDVTKWIAPSWSWVSVRAPVYFPFGPLISAGYGLSRPKAQWVMTFAKFFETECDLATSDPTGRVAGGFMKITGRVLSATLSIYKDFKGLRMSNVSLPEEGNDHLLTSVRYFNDRKVSGSVDLDYPEEYLSGGNDHDRQWEVLLVPIARVQRIDSEQLSVKEVDYALVLAKIEQEKYKRIGIVQEARDSGIQRYVEDPVKMWQERPGCFENLGTETTVMIV